MSSMPPQTVPQTHIASDDSNGAALASLLSNQVSSDELIDSEDLYNIHEIILEGREESEVEEYPYDSDLIKTSPSGEIITFNLWSLLCKGAINFVLPFINGIMLGFGEILAHEIGFRYGFIGARVFPVRRYDPKKKSKFI